MPIGNRILPMPARPDKALISEFAQMVTPHISDSMGRLYGAGPSMQAMYNGQTLAGPAFTVKVTPGDNLLVHWAIDTAQPGDVIVVDAGGICENAIIGEQMSSRAEQRGVAGMIIWGAIRDSAELGESSFPVFASGVSHRGPYKEGPGEINVPIVIGDMVVMPGDIIVGDADGIVAVPQSHAKEILDSAKSILAKETKNLKEIKAGTVNRDWVVKGLRDKGYAV